MRHKIVIATGNQDKMRAIREIFSDLALGGTEVRCFARNLGNRFIPHGSMEDLYRACGLDGQSLAAWIEEALRHG